MKDFYIRTDLWLSAEKQATLTGGKSGLYVEGLMCCMGDYLSQCGVKEEDLAPHGMPFREQGECAAKLLPLSYELAKVNDAPRVRDMLEHLYDMRSEIILEDIITELRSRDLDEMVGEEYRLKILKRLFQYININLIIPQAG